jgi:hypothetical protein
MKVVIYIFGEGDFKVDTLPAHLVPTFASHLKYSFEKNGVPTIVLESDARIEGDPQKFTEITHLLHSNINIYDELRKAQETTNNLNHLPDRWRNEANKIHVPVNDYGAGWRHGVKWCADDLESYRNERG